MSKQEQGLPTIQYLSQMTGHNFADKCVVCFLDIEARVYSSIPGESLGRSHWKGRQPGNQESDRPGKK